MQYHVRFLGKLLNKEVRERQKPSHLCVDSILVETYGKVEKKLGFVFFLKISLAFFLPGSSSAVPLSAATQISIH